MPDGAAQTMLQRSRGAAMASFARRRGTVRLDDLRQAGSAKVMLPRGVGVPEAGCGDSVPEVVFLNTSGGLTGGDHLSYELTLDRDCRVLATTQTAERAYDAAGQPAVVEVTAKVGPGSRLDWLPQETLLYQAAHLERRTVIDLAADATCLLAETVILGRHAMGERLTDARLSDQRMITRQGRPVWAEHLALTPGVLTSPSPALLNSARAFAVVCLVAQGAEDAVGPVRQVLGFGAQDFGAASGWDGKCVVRLTAMDGWPLKQQLARVLRVLTGRALPRVWQNGDA